MGHRHVPALRDSACFLHPVIEGVGSQDSYKDVLRISRKLAKERDDELLTDVHISLDVAPSTSICMVCMSRKESGEVHSSAEGSQLAT